MMHDTEKTIDNYIEWVIFNDANTTDIGKRDIVPIPENFLPKLFIRAKYWSKHYPGGKVFLVFDILDTSLLTQEQIDNVNSAMQKIADACSEFEKIVVVNFSDLKQEVLKDNSNPEECERKNPYFELLEKRRSGVKSALAKPGAITKGHKGAFVDLERYVVIDNFPPLRKMLGMAKDTHNRPVLYTDIDIVLNEIIDPELIDQTLLGRDTSIGVENSAIFAKFTEKGENKYMQEVISGCLDSENNQVAERNLNSVCETHAYDMYWHHFVWILLGEKALGSNIMTDVVDDTMGKNTHFIKTYINSNILKRYAKYANDSYLAILSASEAGFLRKICSYYMPSIKFSDMEDPIATVKGIRKMHKRKKGNTDEDLQIWHNIVTKHDKYLDSLKQKTDMHTDLHDHSATPPNNISNFSETTIEPLASSSKSKSTKGSN